MGHKTPGFTSKTQKQHEASHFPPGAQQSTQTRPPVVNGLSASARQLSSCGFSSQEDPMVSGFFVGWQLR